MTTDHRLTAAPVTHPRRRILQAGAAATALGLLGAPGLVRAQSGPKIRIGYWPIAAGLPFYSAVELGYFKEAGLDPNKPPTTWVDTREARRRVRRRTALASTTPARKTSRVSSGLPT